MTVLETKNVYYRLFSVLPALENSLSARGLLFSLAYHSARILKAETAQVYLAGRAGNPAFLYASWSQDQITSINNRTINPLVDWVIQHRRSRILSGTDPSQSPDGEAEISRMVRNIILVPVIAGRRVIGALEVINCPYAPQKQDEEMLLHLAAVTANRLRLRYSITRQEQSRLLIQHIRTPLTTLNTISYLLEQPDLANQKRLELASALRTGSSRLNETIDVFEEIDDLDKGRTLIQKRETGMMELLQSACRKVMPLAAEHGVRLACNMLEVLPSIDLDSVLMERVVIQILSNAVLHNRKNGRVLLTAWSEAGQLIVHVQDNGNGIPAGDLPKVFERFYRARNAEIATPGVGLGLSLCKSIIQAHGGEITIKSKLGSGTGVTVKLPLGPNL